MQYSDLEKVDVYHSYDGGDVSILYKGANGDFYYGHWIDYNKEAIVKLSDHELIAFPANAIDIADLFNDGRPIFVVDFDKEDYSEVELDIVGFSDIMDCIPAVGVRLYYRGNFD